MRLSVAFKAFSDNRLFLPAVYDLLDSPDCLPDLLQGSLKNKGRNEAFLLSSFKLQSRAPTSLYSVINPKDNSKYLELSVQAKLSKGEPSWCPHLSVHVGLPSVSQSSMFPAASHCPVPEDRWQVCHHQL